MDLFHFNNNRKKPKGLRKKINKIRRSKSDFKRSDQYNELSKRKGYMSSKEVWYKDQGEHWDGWLKGYSGSGFYNRKNHKRSSEFVYNHINCPGMLICLAEALGIDEDLIKEAMNKSIKNSKYQSRCRIIRETIDWRLISTKLN